MTIETELAQVAEKSANVVFNLAVELDERRLEMARNNARVYGVEDMITFIHGDVTELISSLHYDAAFFDPPWGGPEYQKKTVFGWDDFSPNPLPLIHTALARCETVALSVPVNFNVADLRLDEYELVLQRAEIEQQLWCWNAYYRKTKIGHPAPNLLQSSHCNLLVMV